MALPFVTLGLLGVGGVLSLGLAIDALVADEIRSDPFNAAVVLTPASYPLEPVEGYMAVPHEPAPGASTSPSPLTPASDAPIISFAQVNEVILQRVPGALSLRETMTWPGGRAQYCGDVIGPEQTWHFCVDAQDGEVVEWSQVSD